MAQQRELQVTALRPAARAMDTYVRPEFERNQAAISRLTESIKKTDNERAVREGELAAVAESLAGGPKDLHAFAEGHSSHPAYRATILENRGFQHAVEAAPTIASDFAEWQHSSASDGSDVDAKLNEMFSPIMEGLKGKGGQFLQAGAQRVLIETRNALRKDHVAFLDKRAFEETANSFTLRVDGIVHEKPIVNEFGDTVAPTGFYQRIKELDNLATQYSLTTPLSKGEGNKMVFQSLLDMAKAASPEVAERYLHMASLVRYSKGKGETLRPEAQAAITAAEDLNDARLRAVQAKQKAEQVAAKAAAKKAGEIALTTLLVDNNGEGTFSAELILQMKELNITPENMLAEQAAVAKLMEVKESATQLENFQKYILDVSQNRLDPNFASEYGNVKGYVFSDNNPIHPSRMKEMLGHLEKVEKAQPLLQSATLSQPMKQYIDAAIEMEDDYDIDAKQMKREYTKIWQREMENLIFDHFVENEGPPNSATMRSWVAHVEGFMNKQYADSQVASATEKTEITDHQSAIDAAIMKSEEGGDGMVTAGRFNDIGTTNERTISGDLKVERIKALAHPQVLSQVLNDPTYMMTQEDLTEERWKQWGSVPAYVAFDKQFGEGAFARYYRAYGGMRNNKAYISKTDWRARKTTQGK